MTVLVPRLSDRLEKKTNQKKFFLQYVSQSVCLSVPFIRSSLGPSLSGSTQPDEKGVSADFIHV